MLGSRLGERGEALLNTDEDFDESGAVSSERPKGIGEEVARLRAWHPDAIVVDLRGVIGVGRERPAEDSLQGGGHLDRGSGVVGSR